MSRAGMNWERARSQLRQSDIALKEAMVPSPRRVASVFRQRALQLARRRSEERPALAGRPVLVCRLGREDYGIELKDLVEVVPFTRCTPIPGAPPQFLGVTNFRGEIRPVLELGRLLGGTGVEDPETGFVLVLRQPRREIGLRVDHIDGLRQIRQEELAPAEPGSYVTGLTADGLMLLSVQTLLVAVFPKEES